MMRQCGQPFHDPAIKNLNKDAHSIAFKEKEGKAFVLCHFHAKALVEVTDNAKNLTDDEYAMRENMQIRKDKTYGELHEKLVSITIVPYTEELEAEHSEVILKLEAKMAEKPPSRNSRKGPKRR